MKTKLQIAIEALQDIRTWNEDLNDQWGDPGERAKNAISDILKAEETKRHPSEITLSELIEIANIITFETDGCYIDTPYGKTGSNVMLRNKNGKILILIGLGENGFVLSVGTGRNFKLEFPHFSESIQIAAYLDSIGIEYRSKSEEQ